jgi:hypothetical protein
MIGAVSAMVAATLGERLVLIARMARGLGLSDEDKETLREVAKIALAAAVAGVAAAILEATLRARPPLLVLAACTPTFAVIYALTIARLKIVKRDDLERLSAVFTRLRG